MPQRGLCGVAYGLPLPFFRIIEYTVGSSREPRKLSTWEYTTLAYDLLVWVSVLILVAIALERRGAQNGGERSGGPGASRTGVAR